MNVESSAPRTMQPSRPLVNLMRLAGIDFHILQTLLQRSWAILAGGMTALLIPSFLSPLQQGYYFTFSAVLAAQIFFELGLNHVLVQLTSHAAAHLQRISKTDFDGDFRWRNAIISLLALSSKWNSLMASLFFTTMLLGGSWFFIETGTLPMSQWLTVWVLLVFAFAINLALSSRLAICEGLGEVGQVAQLRLGQSIIGYCILWLLLVYGAGLWAIVAVPLTNAVGTLWWISQRRLSKSFGVRSANSTVVSSYSYVRDVFPLQWRIAISWVSGFFIYTVLHTSRQSSWCHQFVLSNFFGGRAVGWTLCADVSGSTTFDVITFLAGHGSNRKLCNLCIGGLYAGSSRRTYGSGIHHICTPD